MQGRKWTATLGLAALGLAALGLAGPAPADAQLAEVRQTIFGMDCAPCAYAVERRMTGMDGATDVQLSLNEGFAAVRFGETHGTTLEQIREAIRDSGFGAREARVRVRGTLALEDGVPVLRTPAGERFRIETAPSADLPDAGTEAELQGVVAREADEVGRWRLEVGRTG